MELVIEFRPPPEAWDALYASNRVFFSSSVDLEQFFIQCFWFAPLALLRHNGGSLAVPAELAFFLSIALSFPVCFLDFSPVDLLVESPLPVPLPPES
jgi:hypothetical protein